MPTFRRTRRPLLGQFPPRGTTPRPVEWRVLTGVPFTMAPAGGGFSIAISDAVLSEFTKPTIVRIRGELFVNADNSDPGAVQTIYVGLAVVDQRQAAIGVTALPRPFSDGDGNRWMYWRAITTAGNAALIDGINWQTFDVDVRSMRKVAGENEELVFVGENPSSNNSVTVQLNGRALIKE